MSKTIMFIHGMFLNPKSWEPWMAYFEEKGYRCVAPAWPLHEGEPADLRSNVPPGLGELALETVLQKTVIDAANLDDPIIIGHSVGGLLVQLLLARGIGSLGVPICSVAPNRMLAFDWGFMKNSAAINNPLKGDAPYRTDPDTFYENFGNTMPRAESDAAFERYAMHESRNILRDCMTDVAKIDVDAPHAPMLFIGASEDQIVPSALCARNAKAYTNEKSRADFMEFKGRGHFICGQSGWEEVAAYIESWIEGKQDPG